jgi:hypothetical protein
VVEEGLVLGGLEALLTPLPPGGPGRFEIGGTFAYANFDLIERLLNRTFDAFIRSLSGYSDRVGDWRFWLHVAVEIEGCNTRCRSDTSSPASGTHCHPRDG